MFNFSDRDSAIKEIDNAFHKHGIYTNTLGSEWNNLISHQGECSGSFTLHILVCLETETEVYNFKNRVLALINKYAEELGQLKEKIINEVETYYRENEKNLDDYGKKLFNKTRDYGHYGSMT